MPPPKPLTRQSLLTRLSRWCDTTTETRLCHRPWAVPYQVADSDDQRYGTLVTDGVLAILWLQELDCPPASKRYREILNQIPLGPLMSLPRRQDDSVWQGSVAALRLALKEYDGWQHVRVRQVPGRFAWATAYDEYEIDDELDFRHVRATQSTIRIDWVQQILTKLAAPTEPVQLAIGQTGVPASPLLLLDTPRLRLRLMASIALLPPVLALPPSQPPADET